MTGGGMAELQQTGARSRPDRAGAAALARLSAAARFLVLLAVAFVALVVFGAMPWAGAVAAFVAALLFTALVPQRTASPGGRDRPQEDAVGVEPAATRFAEALPDPCFILDRNGIVAFANERARNAFPLRPGDVLTARMRTPDLVAAFGRVATTGKPEMVEFVERVPTERWYAAWFAPLAGPEEQLPSRSPIVLILDDLSERRQTERVRVDFVANASHELRTPLASLIGFIDTLQGSAKDDPAARSRFLDIMREQATRMSRLIDDLLSLSRIELKAHVRPRDPVDLIAVLRHVIDAHTPLAEEHQVRIERNLPEGRAIVPGDRDELIQVFDNLIDNACKYGQSGGRVVVTLTAPPPGELGECRVAVRDFGPGIPPEHVPRLTERFYRVESNGRQHRGTGLGLAIVKHIVTRHHARLLIESRPGEGASFTIVFPQGRSPASTEDDKNRPAKSSA